MISVVKPPNLTNGTHGIIGPRAVTSPSGKGVIVQYSEHFYELTCEVSGCSWKILHQKLRKGVTETVLMALPSDYTCN